MSTSASTRSRGPEHDAGFTEAFGILFTACRWRFLAAHERAMADLEESQGTAEDQALKLRTLALCNGIPE